MMLCPKSQHIVCSRPDCDEFGCFIQRADDDKAELMRISQRIIEHEKREDGWGNIWVKAGLVWLIIISTIMFIGSLSSLHH